MAGASQNAAEADLEEQINLYRVLLNDVRPTDMESIAERNHYEDVLYTLNKQLAQLRNGTVAAPGLLNASHQPAYPGAVSPAASVASLDTAITRKRNLAYDDYPDSKRVSLNPSPDAIPGTPMSPEFEVPSAWPNANNQNVGLPNSTIPFRTSRPGNSVAGPSTSSLPPNATIIDLTGPDPQEIMFGNTHGDPFPELAHAYQPGFTNTPANTGGEEWLSIEELAQYLLSPTSDIGGYGINPNLQQQGFPPNEPANELSMLSSYGPSHIPFIPEPQVPWPKGYSEDDSDYGDPITHNDVEAVDKIIDSIKERGDDDCPVDEREQTPKIMCSQLKEYQKIGLTWLLKMEKGNMKGGILADEMGLGKTVQALSLICAHPSTDPLCKTTLIIAPVALMEQWKKEIQRHVKPQHQLKVYVYHRGGKSADFAKLRNYDVVLTTFGTLGSEMKSIDTAGESDLVTKKMRSKLALLSDESKWYRVILDEAQMIKNKGTWTSKGADRVNAVHRLCMTGTPMMNSLDELYPLVRFLKVDGWLNFHYFNDSIGKPIKSTDNEARKMAMQRAQILLKSVMLRRGKTSIVDGSQVCTIPAKHTQREDVTFTQPEQDLYKALETKSQLKFNKYLRKGTVANNYANVLVLLLRLRQACCHPHLINDLSQPATEGIAEDDLLSRAEQLSEEVVTRLKDTDSFECPICFEVDLNPTIILPCGHTVCGACFQKLVDPAQSIREGNEDGSGAKCPHCRGSLSSSMITDYRHYCKVYFPERVKEEELSSESDQESEDDDEDDVDDNGNLSGFVVPDGADDDWGPSGGEPGEDGNGSAVQRHPNGNKGKGRAKPKVTLAQLKKESLRNKEAKKKYLRRLKKNWKSSAKIDKTLATLQEIRENDPTEKTLIFSQFTSLLDLLEVPLLEKKFRYQRYDGSMRPNDRVDAVNKFMDEADETIMLISLKAGNAGLNLWKASRVIILDPFWNPFIEEQAIDRAHRMPQEREVHVHRILVPETVEDRICALQDKKRDIINTALDERVGQSLTRLNVQELKFLFGLG